MVHVDTMQQRIGDGSPTTEILGVGPEGFQQVRSKSKKKSQKEKVAKSNYKIRDRPISAHNSS